MNKPVLEALADRVGALSGPSREVDADIYAALNPHMKPVTPRKEHRGRFFDPTKTNNLSARKYIMGGGATGLAPRYTDSLDAAMTLVPEGWNWMAGERNQGRCRAYVNNNERALIGIGARPNPNNIWHEVVAATPELALTAAALRARAAQ